MEYRRKGPIIFERAKQLDSLSVPLADLSDGDVVVFDLSSVNFMKPPSVIGMLVLIEHLLKLPVSCQLRILPPKDKDVLDYLVKIDFVKTLRFMGSWRIPKGHQVPSENKIRPVIPITRFRTADEIETIANAMQSKFRTELVGLTTLLQPCHVVFSELAENVIHHANSDGGFVLAQQYNYAKGPVLEVAVGDCGIGISASLKQIS